MKKTASMSIDRNTPYAHGESHRDQSIVADKYVTVSVAKKT